MRVAGPGFGCVRGSRAPVAATRRPQVPMAEEEQVSAGAPGAPPSGSGFCVGRGGVAKAVVGGGTARAKAEMEGAPGSSGPVCGSGRLTVDARNGSERGGLERRAREVWGWTGLWSPSVVSPWRHHLQIGRVGSPAICQGGELVRLCRGCGVATCTGTELCAFWAGGQTGGPRDQVLGPKREG